MHDQTPALLRPYKQNSMGRRASSPDFHMYTTPNGVTTIPPVDPAEIVLYPLSMDQSYHTGKAFTQTLEHFDRLGVTVMLVLTAYLGRFKLQVESGTLSQDKESEQHDFETTESVREQTTKINKGWLELNVENNPLCQKMLQNGKLVITEWEKDWLHEHNSTYLTIFYRVQELYATGTLVTEATNTAVKKYFDTAMERLRTNAIVQSLRQKRGDEFIISEYTKPVLEEEAMMALWDFLGYKQMAYPVDYHGNGSTSFYLFKAVQFILSQFSAHPEPMKLLNIKIPPLKEKGMKEKSTATNLPTSRKGSLDASSQGKKEKSQKHANSRKLSLKDEVVDQFRTLTLLEDERGHQEELLDKQAYELAVREKEVEELSIEVDFLKNIAYGQAQDLRHRDRVIQTLTAEKDQLVTALQVRDERITTLTAEKDELASTFQEKVRLMQEQMQEFQRDREAMLKKIQALEEKARQQAHIPEDTRAQPKALPSSIIHTSFFPPVTVLRPQSASAHEPSLSSTRLKRQTMPDCSGFDHRLQEKSAAPEETFIPVSKTKRPHTCPDLARNEGDIAFKF